MSRCKGLTWPALPRPCPAIPNPILPMSLAPMLAGSPMALPSCCAAAALRFTASSSSSRAWPLKNGRLSGCGGGATCNPCRGFLGAPFCYTCAYTSHKMPGTSTATHSQTQPAGQQQGAVR